MKLEKAISVIERHAHELGEVREAIESLHEVQKILEVMAQYTELKDWKVQQLQDRARRALGWQCMN